MSQFFKILSHVSVTVTDVAKARDFYSGVLGFQEIARPAFDFPGIWYSLGGDLQLHIILNDQLVRDGGGAREDRGPLPALRALDRRRRRHRAPDPGAGPRCRDVISGPTGLRQLFVKDPDGNMVEFLGPSASAGQRRMEPAGSH